MAEQSQRPDRRDLLRLATGSAVGITTLALPHASAQASTLTPVLASSSLVLHLDAATSASAGSWTDRSGNANPVTFPAAPAAPTFDAEGFFSFDGGDHLELGTLLAVGGAYTIEAWVRDEGGSPNRNIVSSRGDVLFVSGSTLYGGTGGSYLIVESAGFPTGTWTHVAYTHPGASGTARLYVDGVHVDESTPVSTVHSGGALRIGAHSLAGGDPTSFWNGDIAQVRIYSEALTASAVAANHAATSEAFA